MDNLFEKIHAQLNEDIFYKEFSFSKTDFVPSAGHTKEFADHVTWLDDLLIIYQLKERNLNDVKSPDSEKKWFENKVLKKASRQIRDTLEFLDENKGIELRNRQNHLLKLQRKQLKTILKLVVYSHSDLLPKECLKTRFKRSSSAGFIHLIPWHDYQHICKTLVTPAELAEFFQWRESVVEKWVNKVEIPSENALLGQFTSIHLYEQPSENYKIFLEKLNDIPEDFLLSPFLQNIGQEIVDIEGTESSLAYYSILAEFAKLPRQDLYELKKRFKVCIEAVHKDKLIPPTRIISTTTGCGFVLIPVDSQMFEKRKNALRNLTFAAKYDSKLEKLIGVTFAKKGEFWSIEWALLYFPWQIDEDLAAKLKENYPFRKLELKMGSRYNLKDDGATNRN